MTVDELGDPWVDDVEQEAHANDDGANVTGLYLHIICRRLFEISIQIWL